MPNIIADIAGQYDALMRLLKKMPDEEVISLGDMVDRGPNSKGVIEWFMKNGHAILANHEHMMLCHYRKPYEYENGIWQYNGGDATLASFGGQIPEEVLDWVEQLPRYLEFQDCLLSHAFLHPKITLAEAASGVDCSPYSLQGGRSIIWNRSEPIPRPEYKLQIAGHNSHMGLKWFNGISVQPPAYGMGLAVEQEASYAVCLDASRQKVLTGIHLPSMEIYQVEY